MKYALLLAVATGLFSVGATFSRAAENVGQAAKYEKIDDIPLVLFRQLQFTTTREQYIASILNHIRQNGTDRRYLEQENADALEAQARTRQIAQQVSRILQLDLNADGKVDKKEVEAFVRQQTASDQNFTRLVEEYMKFDANGDGVIDFQEMRESAEPVKDQGAMQIKELLVLDPNRDGKLTVAELTALAAAAFDVADADKDGILSNEEKKVLTRSNRIAKAPQLAKSHLAQIDTFLASLPKDTEFHIVGVYEAQEKNASGVGRVPVHVTRSKAPVVLMLSAYKSVDWHITLDKKVELKGVIVAGPKTSEVINLPKDVPVHRVDAQFGYGLNDRRAAALKDELSAKGLHTASWQGDYYAQSYIVSDDFIYQPQKAYQWPRDRKLPDNAEIQSIFVRQGQPITEVIKYSTRLDSDSGILPRQLATIELANKTMPTLLVLSSPSPTVWRIADAKSKNIVGVILAGPNFQYLDTALEKVPVVMWLDQTGGIYNGLEYRKLANEVENVFGRKVTGYTGIHAASDVVRVAGGEHFPSKDEIQQQPGMTNVPSSARVWDKAGEYEYKVPSDCTPLQTMTWGGGGAGGSWSYGNNGGGGGAFVQDSYDHLGGQTIKIVVGGGGKVGTHLSEKNDKRILPDAGKGGFPDGGNGGTGYDATGGGGGGASRLIVDPKPILVAGGGGGGGGHGSASGLGGGSQVFKAIRSGASGQAGIGGDAGKLASYNVGKDNLHAGESGRESKGGDGGYGGRKGGGGGGGGYGGGGGGAPEFHEPGGGGGGGSLGKTMVPGITEVSASLNYSPSRYGSRAGGAPGNADQAGSAGFGGEPTKDGADGKVVLWCSNSAR